MSIVDKAAKTVMSAVQGAMEKAVELAPDSWVPMGKPDPLARPRARGQHGHIGTPVSRIDGPLKVQGSARFAAEFAPADMAYAAVVFSTIPKGRITAIDTEAARSAPGVVLVMTHSNAPRLRPMPVFMSKPKAGGGDSLPIMQDDRIHWNGQPVAVVLAETQEQADYAKSLIEVTYQAESAATTLEAAKAIGTQVGTFQGQPLKTDIGDAEAALAEAPHKVDHVYNTPRNNHNAIEPHAATVLWEGDRLVVHDATQAVNHAAWSLATIFGIDEEQVHVTSPYVGGGFGSKTLWQHQVLGAAAAKLAGRPVRINLSREGVFRIIGGRSETEQRFAIGALADGKFEAIIHTGMTPKTPHNGMVEPFTLATQGGYESKTFSLEVQTTELDMLANTFMRAPGEAVGTFAMECAIDEMAIELGMDPIDLRLRNEPEKHPTKGSPWSMRNTAEMYRMGAERFGWDQRQAPGMRREGEWLVGLGMATGTYPYHRMAGGAARIKLTRQGTGVEAQVDFAAHEMGMGTSTTHMLVAADRLGLPLDQVKIGYGDSEMPGVILAGGSQQTASIGAAVIAAHRELVGELIKLAGNDSPLAGLSPDEVVGHEGGLAKWDDLSAHESYADILARAQRDEISVEGQAAKPLELQHWAMHSYAAMFCEVRVNAVTAETRVTRFLGAFDCGRILNPKTAASQFRGGIIMGLGLALMEETEIDGRNGRIMNPSLAEYHVPVHLDVPAIDILWTDIPDPHAPMGAHGIGEIGITGTAAAVANAIYNATGKRVRDLPITLDKLL